MPKQACSCVTKIAGPSSNPPDANFAVASRDMPKMHTFRNASVWPRSGFKHFRHNPAPANPPSNLRDIYASFLRLLNEIPLGNGKDKFVLGAGLVVWPLISVMLLPSAYLTNLDGNLFSSGRVPVAIFSIVALISEAAAVFLFFPWRSQITYRPENRTNSWSVVATAVAGISALAFLVAAVANVVRVW